MLRALLILTLILSITFSLAVNSETNLCHSFSFMATKNLVSKSNVRSLTAIASGVTQKQYNAVLNKVIKVYGPIVQQMGYQLDMPNLWSSNFTNALAFRDENKMSVAIHGGIARFQGMSELGLTAVICHELGHHIGGAPTVLMGDHILSVEGQADYFAMSRCMKKIYSPTDNKQFLKQLDIKNLHPLVLAKCSLFFKDSNGRANCYRSSLAGLNLANIFNKMSGEVAALNFNFPDSNVAEEVITGNTNAQCRLDTYFRASLCYADPFAKLSLSNPNQGTCYRDRYSPEVVRPLCWYKPDTNWP